MNNLYRFLLGCVCTVFAVAALAQSVPPAAAQSAYGRWSLNNSGISLQTRSRSTPPKVPVMTPIMIATIGYHPLVGQARYSFGSFC